MKQTAKKYFDMTLEECQNVLETIDGLIIIDKNGVIKFMSPDMKEVLEELYEVPLPKVVAGRNIMDLHPTSKIFSAFSLDQPANDYFYLSKGIVNVARIKPVIKDGEIVGAIDYDLFTDTVKFSKFMDKTMELVSLGALPWSEIYHNSGDDASKGLPSKNKVSDLVGDSPVMSRLRQRIYDLAETDSTVLITGETGTGKEIVAQALHGISKRSRYPIIEVNCASIPEHLFESELFGYEEGAFTGAVRGGRLGRFQLADKGTIFLDEVDQISLAGQAKLLRTLQEHEVITLGGKKVSVDIRVIAATNKNLKELVAQGKFREDLYYRLDVINIDLPPLRDRREDIKQLIDLHIRRLNPIINASITGISPKALSLLEKYDWPGNVRQLFNIIERAMNERKEGTLTEVNFPGLSRGAPERTQRDEDAKAPQWLPGTTLETILDDAEKAAISRVLSDTSWNVTAAARRLGITRSCLHYKMKKHGIQRQVRGLSDSDTV